MRGLWCSKQVQVAAEVLNGVDQIREASLQEVDGSHSHLAASLEGTTPPYNHKALCALVWRAAQTVTCGEHPQQRGAEYKTWEVEFLEFVATAPQLAFFSFADSMAADQFGIARVRSTLESSHAGIEDFQTHHEGHATGCVQRVDQFVTNELKVSIQLL